MAAELATLPDPAAATPEQMHALLASVYKKTGMYLCTITTKSKFYMYNPIARRRRKKQVSDNLC